MIIICKCKIKVSDFILQRKMDEQVFLNMNIFLMDLMSTFYLKYLELNWMLMELFF
jgi:hypothetical protein